MVIKFISYFFNRIKNFMIDLANKIRYIQNGESVDEEVLNRPTEDLANRVTAEFLSIQELQDFSTVDLEEGDVAKIQNSYFEWKGNEWIPTTPVSIKLFGAQGDGVTDDFNAVQDAVDFAPSMGGMVITFPDGVYYTTPKSLSSISNCILVEKDNIRFVSENKHKAELRNFLILARGQYGSKFNISQDITESGLGSIGTATAHDFSEGSYIQLLSSINPYSSDAGDWQGGSTNPTKLEKPNAIFSEIHKIASTGTNSLELIDTVIFPVYTKDTTGQSDTISGIDGAYVREIVPVQGFECVGLHFHQELESFDGINIQLAAGGGIYGCKFTCVNDTSGIHVRVEESFDMGFEENLEYRQIGDGAGGSSWNSFIIGGGCQNITIRSNKVRGGWQVFDVTPLLSQSLLFGNTRDHGTDDLFMTPSKIDVSDNEAYDVSEIFTTHPASYFVNVSNNTVENSSNGVRLRSRKNVVVGNNFRTYRSGIALSSFYEDTLITGNVLNHMPDVDGLIWVGVAIVPMSSETMNTNDLKNVRVAGNTFNAVDSNVLRIGVDIRHTGNGTPPNPSFTEFTDSIKTGISHVVVEDNTFNNCNVRMGSFINGVLVKNNVFDGVNSYDYWIDATSGDSVRNLINMNYFYSAANIAHVGVTNTTTITYPYSAFNIVGEQIGWSLRPIVEAPNTPTMLVTGRRLTVADGYNVANGGSYAAVRESGTADARMDGRVLDGTSRSIVRFNYDGNPSDRRAYNYGQFINDGNIWPAVDNSNSVGVSVFRWAEIYAANATINTSDGREKQDVRELSVKEKAVALKLKDSIKAYRWIHAVEEKGDAARIHFGAIAQEVRDIFAEEGLDASEYSLFCYDEWDDIYGDEDEDGNAELIKHAGNRYGLRYEQLLAFIISAM